eukprot:97858-Chlamydomonas_euryale.AAC.9
MEHVTQFKWNTSHNSNGTRHTIQARPVAQGPRTAHGRPRHNRPTAAATSCAARAAPLARSAQQQQRCSQPAAGLKAASDCANAVKQSQILAGLLHLAEV